MVLRYTPLSHTKHSQYSSLWILALCRIILWSTQGNTNIFGFQILPGTVALVSQNNNLCGKGVYLQSYSAYTTWWGYTWIFQITMYQLTSMIHSFLAAFLRPLLEASCTIMHKQQTILSYGQSIIKTIEQHHAWVANSIHSPWIPGG